MTVQNSAAKNGAFYKFLPYFRNKLRYLRPQFIMSCILALLSYPAVGAVLYPMCSIAREHNELVQSNASTELKQQLANKMSECQSMFVAMAVVGVLCLVGLFVFTFVTTLRSFRYLYDKTYADMDMSLPVNHNTRFFGDLAAVAVTNLLPHLAAILIGIFMLHTCGLEGVSDTFDFDAVYRMIEQCMFTGLFSCIMQIGLSLLMLSFCGRKAEAYIYPVLVNIAIPIIHGLAFNLVKSGIYGAPDMIMYNAVSEMFSISFTSPLGMVFVTMFSGFFSTEGGSLEALNMPMFMPAYGIPALILTLAFFAGAYFLIKYRRSERVGMSYVYRGMDMIIPGVVVLAITLPFSGTIFKSLRGYGMDIYYSYTPSVPSLVIWLVVLSFIAYVIMALISGKNFRRFHITLAKWAGTLAVSVGISAGLAFSNGFGMSYYIPGENAIASVTIDMEGGIDYNGPVDYHVHSDDPELVKTALGIHGDIPKHDQNDTTRCSVSLTYVMKNGETLSRTYWVTNEQFADYMHRVCTPDLWYLQLTGGISDKVKNPDKYYVGIVDAGNDRKVYYNFTVGELIGAIKADCQKASYDMLSDVSGVYEYRALLDFTSVENEETTSRSLVVYSWMDNTLKLFKDAGYDIVQNSVISQYKTAFIVDLDSNQYQSYSLDVMFGYAQGMDEQQLAEYLDDYYPEDLIPQITYGCAHKGDSGIEELLAVGTNVSLYISSRYSIMLSTAESLGEYVSGSSDEMIVNIPNEYNDLAEQILQRYLVYTVDNSSIEDYSQEVA